MRSVREVAEFLAKNPTDAEVIDAHRKLWAKIAKCAESQLVRLSHVGTRLGEEVRRRGYSTMTYAKLSGVA